MNKLITTVAVSLITSCMAVAQSAPQKSPLLESEQRALRVLTRSMEAHGGMEAARSFLVRASLENQSVHQGLRPDPPFGAWTVRALYVVDPAKDRFLYETDARFPSFRNFTRTISVAGKGTLIDYLAKTVVPEENVGGAVSLLNRILPQNLLREASNRRASLRWVGKTYDKGRTLQAISYVRPSGELYTLSFDSDTGLLAKLESLQANTIDGDVVFVHEYEDYREQSGAMLPHKYQIRRGPRLATTARIEEIEIGFKSPDDLFVAPPGHRTISSYDPPMTFETIAPNVHVINYVPDGYNVLCVEFSDHLVVIETPESNSPSGTSEQVVDFIKSKLPNKPIRFAVPTHHHSDHVGGIRAYLAEGATVISTQGNERFLDRLAQRRYTLWPDRLSIAKTAPRFELLQGESRILTDAMQELHLYRVRGAPHVEEILVAYLPKQKVLFQTDLFNAWACFRKPVPNEDIGHTTALGDTQALIAAVEKLQLPVERVIGGHGREVDYQWLKQYTARRAADGLPMWACTAEEMR